MLTDLMWFVLAKMGRSRRASRGLAVSGLAMSGLTLLCLALRDVVYIVYPSMAYPRRSLSYHGLA